MKYGVDWERLKVEFCTHLLLPFRRKNRFIYFFFNALFYITLKVSSLFLSIPYIWISACVLFYPRNVVNIKSGLWPLVWNFQMSSSTDEGVTLARLQTSGNPTWRDTTHTLMNSTNTSEFAFNSLHNVVGYMHVNLHLRNIERYEGNSPVLDKYRVLTEVILGMSK